MTTHAAPALPTIDELDRAIDAYRRANVELDTQDDIALCCAIDSAQENAADLGLDVDGPAFAERVVCEVLGMVDELGLDYVNGALVLARP